MDRTCYIMLPYIAAPWILWETLQPKFSADQFPLKTGEQSSTPRPVPRCSKTLGVLGPPDPRPRIGYPLVN